MNSTLKPSLLVDALSLQRKSLSPQKLCGLFLANRNFSEAFALAFQQRGKARHHYSGQRRYRDPYFCETYVGYDRPDEPFTIIATKDGIVFQFTKEYHVPALLRTAGRLIPQMDTECPNERWVEPFFEGLDENKCLEFVGSDANKLFLQKYLRRHDSITTMECNNFSLLDGLNKPKINKLVVHAPLGQECRENHDRVRITNIEVICCTMLRGNPLNGRDQTLKFDKKCLKRVHFNARLPPDAAARMIKAYSYVDEMEFNRVRINSPTTTKTIQEGVDRLNVAVNKLWTAMTGHNAAAFVQTYYDCALRVPSNEITDYCQKKLTGYTIISARYIECNLVKKTGNKTLEVYASFASRG